MVLMPVSDLLQTLDRDLRGIFGARLQSLSVYGERAHASHASDGHGAHGHDAVPVRTLAVVQTLTADDLRGCAGRVEAWHAAGLATPLVLAADEFGRSL